MVPGNSGFVVDIDSEFVSNFVVALTRGPNTTMSDPQRIQALLARLMAMPPDQLEQLLPAAPNTPTGTTVTGQVGAPHLRVLPPTLVTTNLTTIVSSPAVHNVTFAQGVAGIPVPPATPPVQPPPTLPANPHRQGSLLYQAFTIPEVTPAELLPYYEFHGGAFNAAAAKEKLGNLANMQTCITFAAIRASDSRIKIMHSMAKYRAPFGKETGDANHDTFFFFKGDRSSRSDPPVVQLTTAMLQEFKIKDRTAYEIREHYAQDGCSAIVPINDTEGERDITRMVMLPLKWAAELVDKKCHSVCFFTDYRAYNKGVGHRRW